MGETRPITKISATSTQYENQEYSTDPHNSIRNRWFCVVNQRFRFMIFFFFIFILFSDAKAICVIFRLENGIKIYFFFIVKFKKKKEKKRRGRERREIALFCVLIGWAHWFVECKIRQNAFKKPDGKRGELGKSNINNTLNKLYNQCQEWQREKLTVCVALHFQTLIVLNLI